MRRKLTDDERFLLNDTLRYATFCELLTVGFWDIFNPKKSWTLIDDLKIGMSWRKAFDKAKNCDKTYYNEQ